VKRRCPVQHKVRFRTELDVKIALAARVRRDKGEQRYYFCNPCKGWHLTSQEERP
jgi:hypothetical protein